MRHHLKPGVTKLALTAYTNKLVLVEHRFDILKYNLFWNSFPTVIWKLKTGNQPQHHHQNNLQENLFVMVLCVSIEGSL